ncbi:hypothetical protein THTE_2972 [Thermogutta terrifontis]|uniref:Uncharacterized protein n=1 Tax=Thermogutta terrifontis TaxID=1331910 RepID=A0A286RHX4_9BACT|nr:hypothetical protein THTE_2972 [Thermogutta terrifontis]
MCGTKNGKLLTCRVMSDLGLCGGKVSIFRKKGAQFALCTGVLKQES